jgi:hypothetical protein
VTSYLIAGLGSFGSVVGAWWGYLSWRSWAQSLASEDAARRILLKLKMSPEEFARLTVVELREMETALVFLETRHGAPCDGRLPIVVSNPPEERVPTLALILMRGEDRERYRNEWAAHLSQLVTEGQLREARRDRRRFVLAALVIVCSVRFRRVLRRAGRVR